MVRSLFPSLHSRLRSINTPIDPRSLQWQLTLSIAALMVLGLGGVALWTSLKMRQTLIASHKVNIVEVTHRVMADIDLYSEMFTTQQSVAKAINNRSTKSLLILAKRPDGAAWAQSSNLVGPVWQQVQTPRTLDMIFQEKLSPQIYHLQQRVFVACNSPLVVKGQAVGQLYLVQDITTDQQKLTAVVQTLILATLLAMGLTTVVIALQVRQLLRPLGQISAITSAISVEDLGEKQVDIPHAPSEIRQLVATFNLMLSRLSEAWRQQRYSGEQQRQFVSNVSHELRTPLTIVSGYLQSTLRRQDTLSESQREALVIASTEADHTIRLLQDLLDLARADDGYNPVPLETVILNDAVMDVVRRAQRCHHHPIQVEGTAAIVPVHANPDRLQRVLVNLVENAIQYSQSSDPVTVTFAQQGQQAMVQVCDHGCGIPLQQQARIFERFYRLDEARTRSTGGSGLGLSIVKTFVESMGGQVRVRSLPGQGSTFTVTLPISPKSL